MQTKITRTAEGLMEAAWLAALIIVPVFFNVYSSRIFEPDKIALLRSLALLGLGAWIVKLIDQGRLETGAGQDSSVVSRLRSLMRVPFLPAVAGLALVYLLATIFSVTPRISLFGSYQRLQGTYTAFSYIVFFCLVAANLRRREQIDRLVVTVVLTSLPIGLYGILQKFGIDPIPWGGDTVRRVAANMGNAIFVGAYLIMAFPLTIGQIVDAFSNILDEGQTNLVPQVVRGSIYVFTAAVQLIALYFTLSRGPILGLLAGAFFLVVLLSLFWARRWLTFTAIGLAAAVGLFLIAFNLPGGPFENLRSNENIGRIGNVFQTDSGTGRVRTLIWQGAAELVWFHPPLAFPDGTTDAFATLRPLLGYGPEAMYVAYNPVYPSELANIEARNASPDRSHNETWDALVITGLLGLAAEQFLFLSVFYYGLKWLGLLNSSRQRNLFLILILGGGAASALAFSLLLDVGYFGVGLPFGMLLGLLGYLALMAVFSRSVAPQTAGERARAMTLMAFLAAVIAHYVEIHFGIAIAATRLHFWVYAGVLLAAGYWMTLAGAYGPLARARLSGEDIQALPPEPEAAAAPGKARKGRSRIAAGWERHAWISGIGLGILLATLNFNYLSNPNRLTGLGDLIRQSLTTLPRQDGAVSYGVLAIFLVALLAFAAVAASEWARVHPADWGRVFLMTAGIGGGVWLLHAVIHASSMLNILQMAAPLQGDTVLDPIRRQADSLEGLLTLFYAVTLLLVLWLGVQIGGSGAGRPAPATGRGTAAAAAVLLFVLLASWQFNLKVIQADIAFKMAEPFGRGSDPGNWEIAVELYQRANAYDPLQDHYYLFLGRAALELTRLIQTQDPPRAQELLRQAETDLRRAQEINPLNTDHTANLARLYRFWSNIPGGTTTRAELIQQAADYYSVAVQLSPNNAVIWNEWAVLTMQDLRDVDGGLELLSTSLLIDPQFHGTYGILGDYHGQLAREASTEPARRENVDLAVEYYTQAYALARSSESRYLYAAALGGVYSLVDEYEQAIEAFLLALENAAEGEGWLVEDTIAKIYAQAGDFENALDYARRSLANAPAEQQATQQQLIDYILDLQAAP